MGSARRSVLLVDDDDAIREALSEALAEEGFVVHGAQNGREALDWLQEEGNRDRDPVVLLDLMMPVMDGRTFLGIRHADPSLAKIPVLVISAEPGCAALSDSHRVDGVFLKPVPLDGLIAAIDKCP